MNGVSQEYTYFERLRDHYKGQGLNMSIYTRSTPRDPNTLIEETLEALQDKVRSGKVRYIGASSMHAQQFAKSLYFTDLHGWTRFSAMQNHYNLLYREDEREMMPLCIEEGIAIIPWSPLAIGVLTGNCGRDGAMKTKRAKK